jgi:predicted dehydrogenase
VTRFESRFERFRPEPRDGVWRESAATADAGGVLWDLGPHLIDQACELFGAPLNVYAEVDTRRAGAKVDDDAFVALEHPGGVRSHLWMSQTAAIDGPRMRVSGLAGAYEQPELDPQEALLREGTRPGGPGWGNAPPGRLAALDGERTVESVPGDYGLFYAGVRDAVADGAPAPVDPSDGLRAIRLIDAARRSSAERRVIALG